MQEKQSFKPYFHEFLGYYVCGNPYCGEGINQYSKLEGKCPECGCSYDWGEDK